MTSNYNNEIPKTMKAAVVRELGDADKILVEPDYPTPTLHKGQVLVRNKYAGLNFIDTYYRQGLYQQALPFVCGQEGGGVVVQTRGDVGTIQVGDTVVYMAMGSYAEYTAVPAQKVVPVPPEMDLQVAIACMVQGLTAHYLVMDATAGLIGRDEWCLIYAVGSGTCQWAAQMARLQGYKVIGTTSKLKADAVRLLRCCDELIVLDPVEGKSYADYTSDDIVHRVKKETQGAGVKCVLDGVGLSTYEISLQCLATRGIFVSFGNASGAVPAFPLLKLTPKSAFCTRPKLGDYVQTFEELNGRCQQVFEWLQQGKLKMRIDAVFSLDQAVDGHVYLESGKSKGKVLYQIS